MKRLAMLFLLPLLLIAKLQAQVITNPNGVTLSTATFETANLTSSASSCLVYNNTAVMRVHLPNNAVGVAFTTSGTYVGTVTFQASADNQITWPTAEGSQTAPGTTSVTLNGFTDVCAFVSAFTSGTIVATINVTLNTGPIGPAGPSGSSASTAGNSNMSLGTGAILASDPKYSLPATGYNSCNASWANAATTVATAATDPPFTSAMIGWIIWGSSQTCQTFDGAGSVKVPKGTITSINNAHSANISTTTTAAQTCTGNCGELWWFPADSSPALNAAFADVLLTTNCKNLILPAGLYALHAPIVNATTPQPCSFQTAFGDAQTERTYEIQGQGIHATTLVPMPEFDAATCLTDTIIGGYKVCLFGALIQAGVTIRDLSVNGAGTNAIVNGTGGECVFAGNYISTFTNLAVWNWGYGGTGNISYCLVGNRGGESYGSNLYSYGTERCVKTILGPVNLTGMQCTTAAYGLNVSCSSGATTSNFGTYSSGFAIDANDIIVNSGCSGLGFISHDDIITTGGTGHQAITCQSNCSLDGDFIILSGSPGATASALFLDTNIHGFADNTILSPGTNGAAAAGNAGSAFHDLGGNSFVHPIDTASLTVYGDASITGTAQVIGNIVASTCGTSTNGTLLAGSGSRRGTFTVTFAGAPGATCTETVTFPVQFQQAPSCHAFDVGGTNAIATSIVNGAISTTSYAFTINGTFVNANTEILQYDCGNS